MIRYFLLMSFACLFQASIANIKKVDNPKFVPNTPGPFDKKGDYVTSWADGKWKRYYTPSKKTESTRIVITPEPTRPTKPKPIASYNGKYKTHTVVRGDTLYGISKKYKVSINDLKSINAINNAHLIRIGMSLKIPIK